MVQSPSDLSTIYYFSHQNSLKHATLTSSFLYFLWQTQCLKVESHSTTVSKLIFFLVFAYKVSWNHILYCRYLAMLFCVLNHHAVSVLSVQKKGLGLGLVFYIFIGHDTLPSNALNMILLIFISQQSYKVIVLTLLTSEETESRRRSLSQGWFPRLFHSLVDSRVLILLTIQLALCIHEFYIHRFNQPGIQ